MIKCNVTINGIVSRTASMRTNKEGKSYISFAVKISILAKAGSSMCVIYKDLLQMLVDPLSNFLFVLFA